MSDQTVSEQTVSTSTSHALVVWQSPSSRGPQVFRMLPFIIAGASALGAYKGLPLLMSSLTQPVAMMVTTRPVLSLPSQTPQKPPEPAPVATTISPVALTPAPPVVVPPRSETLLTPKASTQSGVPQVRHRVRSMPTQADPRRRILIARMPMIVPGFLNLFNRLPLRRAFFHPSFMRH